MAGDPAFPVEVSGLTSRLSSEMVAGVRFDRPRTK
jgi:hypothetical protein